MANYFYTIPMLNIIEAASNLLAKQPASNLLPTPRWIVTICKRTRSIIYLRQGKKVPQAHAQQVYMHIISLYAIIII